jgi:hypothetical protein
MKTGAPHTVAVMQPTYLPWMGYFDLIDQADVFVFLEDVEFSKQSWQQRNRIKTSNGILWLTVPVLTKGKSGQMISDVRINHRSNDLEKHVKAIAQSYGKAPFVKSYIDELTAILSTPRDRLADLNMDLIRWFCAKLGIKTPLVKNSDLHVEGSKVERLINICRAVGAERYLSTPGSKVYIDEDNRFSPSGVDLVYQDYVHPTYRQLHGDFVPYLSVLDLLLNEGEGSLSIIRSGRR